MNIKTIACHEVYNHGASLQEHALIKYLKLQGYKAEAIHYKLPYLSKNLNLWDIYNPKYETNFVLKALYILAKLPTRLRDLKRKRVFDKFSSKYIKANTQKLYRLNDDLKNDQRINHVENVIIDNHVWVAAHASILKGDVILSNSVIATRSVVTKKINEENVLLAGTPAKNC
jgi:hypothetical protein